MERLGPNPRHRNDAPKIVLPPHKPATEEEKARRRALGREADRLAALIGPLERSVADIVREIRDEAEGLTAEEESGG